MASHEEHPEVVRLATAANPAEAYILKEALEDERIRCTVVGDYLEAGVGDIPGLRPEIWVNKDSLARAEEILREHRAAAHEEEADEAEEEADEPEES
jgi:hypothetical protein